jgi:DNA-binding NarL/FixJ family response regulator
MTPRQRAVLELIHQGYPGKVIARRLGISLSTLKTHIAALFREFDVHSRLALVARSRMTLVCHGTSSHADSRL